MGNAQKKRRQQERQACTSHEKVRTALLEAIATEALAIADGTKMHVSDLSELANEFRDFEKKNGTVAHFESPETPPTASH